MIRVEIIGNGQTIEFDAGNMKAISEAAAAFGISVETLMAEIRRIVQNYQLACGLDKLKEAMEKTTLKIENLDYEFTSLRKEKERGVYCSYKSKLHAPDKRRCFKPKIHWKRTRSNPR